MFLENQIKFLFTLQTYTYNQQMKLHYKFLSKKL